MKNSAAYSLIEVLIAVVVVGIGLTAAAVMVGAIMSQEELNQVSLRAANLQEQAVTLYRLGVDPGTIRSILPETTVSAATPQPGEFSITFSSSDATNVTVTNGGNLSLERSVCTVVFPNPLTPQGAATYSTNSVTVLRPAIR